MGDKEPGAVMTEVPYGRGHWRLRLPSEAAVETLSSRRVTPLADPMAAVRDALKQPIGTRPLRELVRRGERVAIVVNDVTRLVRTDLFLPVLVEELNAAGIPDRDLLVIFALGNHRRQTPEERQRIVGESLAGRLELVDHDCREAENLVHIGRTRRGNEAWVNRRVWEADRVILTGEIIYHLIAGYSGGRKSLFPGVAGAEFIRVNHRMIFEPGCGVGVLEGNPAHEDLLEACRLFDPDFILNVILSPAGELLNVVAGHYELAHQAGCNLVDQIYGVRVEGAYETVIASAGGYPLDLDLRQANKGMENAARAVRDGGSLLYFAECGEGAGSRALEEWAGRFASAAEFEKALREDFVVGAHKAYWLARLAERVRVYLVSSLDPEFVRKCRLHPVEHPEALAKELLAGRGQRIGYMPSASFTLPVATAGDERVRTGECLSVGKE